jgi:hypothetical protein
VRHDWNGGGQIHPRPYCCGGGALRGLVFRSWGLRFGVCGLGLVVWGMGFKVWGMGYGVRVLGAYDLGCWV